MRQLLTPNPHVRCEPGWCLMYVNDAYGVPAVYGTAIAAWEASTTQHRDWDFPADVWVPVWFTLANVPAGHVALRAPDGAVYSTTDLSNTPRRHPNLDDLHRIYAGAGMPLTYLGWSEDVEGTRVIAPTTTSKDDDMPIILARQKGTDEIYRGDFITRTHVPNMRTLDDLRWAAENWGVPVLFDGGKVQDVDNIDFIGKLI